MEPKARHVLIGLFTALVTVGIVIAVIALGKITTDKRWDYYIIQFNESVSGLSSGSAVEYSGLKIGEVVELELQPNPNIVNAYVRINADVDVREDVVAMLSMVGITGQSVIALSGGTLQAPPLLPQGNKLPVIVATPSPLSQLFSSGEGLMSSFSETLVGIKQLLNEENVAAVSQIIANVETITGAVANESESLANAINELDAIAQAVNQAIEGFQQLTAQTGEVIDKHMVSALDSARVALNKVRDAASTVQSAVANTQEPLTGGLAGLEKVGPAVTEFQRAMSQLNSILREIKAGPGRFILEGEQVEEYNPW